MLIGILQTGLAPDTLASELGDYPDMFARLLDGRGLTFRTWAVVDGEFPESIHDAEGWLITGDHLIQGSTVVIIPPHGRLTDYMRSLRLLLPLGLRALLPGHGKVMTDAEAVVRATHYRLLDD